MSIPDDLKRNLENYLSYLNRKIAFEESLLTLDDDLKKDPHIEGNYLETKEPIMVGLAYQSAREQFLSYFPELRK